MFKAVQSDLVAKAYKYKEESEHQFAERLVLAVDSLSQKLSHGTYGCPAPSIANDVTKLPLAHGLTSDERTIARNLLANTGSLTGCQEVRRRMGHMFRSASLFHGHGLFCDHIAERKAFLSLSEAESISRRRSSIEFR